MPVNIEFHFDFNNKKLYGKFDLEPEFFGNIQLNHEFVAECGKKKILPMKAQEGINVGVLGMTATKYKEVHGITEPFNDNLPVTKVHAKNMALIIATSELAEDPRETISNKEGREIGINSGIIASLVLEDKDFRSELKARIASRAKDLSKIFKKKIQSSKSKAG